MTATVTPHPAANLHRHAVKRLAGLLSVARVSASYVRDAPNDFLRALDHEVRAAEALLIEIDRQYERTKP